MRLVCSRAELYLQQQRFGFLDSQASWAIPAQRRLLVTTRCTITSPTYKFIADNNYMTIAPVGWSTGSEMGGGMTPERRAKVVESIKASGAPAIFVETTINPKIIREIAAEAGIVIGGELYSDSMGAAGTAGESYIGMMRENTMLIVGALRAQ